ncbi:hypothetical protein [Gimesia maris]|uniref:DUF4304 domain-containing protein n=1 Tax=Gimesia maris TaxID=122 RepID=A0ABX5YQF7_9PLAN|nr:hypothetical protein [Gimesia maris]EDL60367.1 3-oxoacyl-(acyl carrier protein) synthase [Gimesia maris DSM 8797]QDT80185.1 hypothetical protein Mal35_36560 [Gimesia maris]QEG17867.1 hypothetical protein GmarT_37510 [Gimesia maris]QGQ29102.1 hypothetical protein F1729_10815 [Gimesia maris]
MTPKQFDKVARQLFAGVLSAYGFTCEGSRYCTFYRKYSDELFHFVLPDLGTHGTWFDVKVFPASPLLDPLFQEDFPDDVGIPTDSYSYLSERGIGLDQEKFNCKTEENMRHRFEASVRPALEDRAIPYLDQFCSIDDIVPVLSNPIFRGIGLHLVGKMEEAIPLLQQQRERLSLLDSDTPAISARLRFIEELLEGF